MHPSCDQHGNARWLQTHVIDFGCLRVAGLNCTQIRKLVISTTIVSTGGYSRLKHGEVHISGTCRRLPQAVGVTAPHVYLHGPRGWRMVQVACTDTDGCFGCIRTCMQPNALSAVAGTTTAGYVDGLTSVARFQTPFGELRGVGVGVGEGGELREHHGEEACRSMPPAG